MNIAFRTDSSFTIGTGHVHRCLNIARKFKEKKIKCYFFSNEYPGNINKIIENEFNLFKLSTKYSKNTYSDKNNITDANSTIKLIKKLNIDLLFLDSYLINEKWEKKISKFCKIVFLSDFLDRKSYCDYYINYNILYENSYIEKNLPKDSKKLIGTNYCIVKKFIINKKKKLKKKITVFMGGVDKKNFTTKLVHSLSDKLFKNYEKNIIIGVRNKNTNHIKKQVNNLKNFKIIKGNKKNLYSIFSNSKLVITAVSTSMHEHFALGTNSIVIPQNKLQNRIIKNLSILNLINFTKYKKEIDKNYINKVLNQKNLLKKKKILKNLVDTKGVDRIVEYFLSKNIIQKAKLKKASKKDIFFLFKLVNDPKVIKNSLSQKNVNFKNHNDWFKKALQKKNISIYIFKTANHKLGQVRFDTNSQKQTYITYAVSNEFRRANVGYKMLNLAIKKNSIKTNLCAIVKKDNEASKKIFIKLGFLLFKKDQKRGLFYYLKK